MEPPRSRDDRRPGAARVRRRVYDAVERRGDDLGAQELAREYVARNRPVVLSTRSDAWIARWSAGALAARYGDHPIEVEPTDVVYVGERARTTRPLGAVVQAILEGDPSLRWKGLDFLSRVPGMREELVASAPPHDALLPAGAADLRRTLWIAPGGTTSSLHHDGDYDNLNLQVSGRKLFVLVPPARDRLLYRYGSAESPINPFSPDLRRFPRFARADPVEATLEPGDVLLVPKYWWHCVYALEPAVNLSTHFTAPEQPSTWRVLAGAPLVRRALTVAAVTLKRRGLRRVADSSRALWWTCYSRVVPRPAPQARPELVDPEVAHRRRFVVE